MAQKMWDSHPANWKSPDSNRNTKRGFARITELGRPGSVATLRRSPPPPTPSPLPPRLLRTAGQVMQERRCARPGGSGPIRPFGGRQREQADIPIAQIAADDNIWKICHGDGLLLFPRSVQGEGGGAVEEEEEEKNRNNKALSIKRGRAEPQPHTDLVDLSVGAISNHLHQFEYPSWVLWSRKRDKKTTGQGSGWTHTACARMIFFFKVGGLVVVMGGASCCAPCPVHVEQRKKRRHLLHLSPAGRGRTRRGGGLWSGRKGGGQPLLRGKGGGVGKDKGKGLSPAVKPGRCRPDF